MSHEATDDFVPDRERVADADAEVPVIDVRAFVARRQGSAPCRLWRR